MQYGGVPLYVRGEDDKAKQFRSLHSVQRHMIDSNQCKMAYDDNEEEYEDYYDYDAATSAEAASTSGASCAHGGATLPAPSVWGSTVLSCMLPVYWPALCVQPHGAFWKASRLPSRRLANWAIADSRLSSETPPPPPPPPSPPFMGAQLEA